MVYYCVNELFFHTTPSTGTANAIVFEKTAIGTGFSISRHPCWRKILRKDQFIIGFHGTHGSEIKFQHRYVQATYTGIHLEYGSKRGPVDPIAAVGSAYHGR